MRTYQDINPSPSIGDVYQAEAEDQGLFYTYEELSLMIKDRFTFPTLYVAMAFLEDQNKIIRHG